MTPPLFSRIFPSFWMTPLLVTVPMLKLTFDATINVSPGPITRVATVHVEVSEVHTPPTDGASHDILSLTVEDAAIAFWAENPRTKIIATSTGSTSIFFMYVIVS